MWYRGDGKALRISIQTITPEGNPGNVQRPPDTPPRGISNSSGFIISAQDVCEIGGKSEVYIPLLPIPREREPAPASLEWIRVESGNVEGCEFKGLHSPESFTPLIQRAQVES